MHFGLFAMNYGTCAQPEQAVRIARHAEAAGFESLWTGEHLALPSPRPSGFGIDPQLPFLDTVAALTLLATATERVKLGTGIIILPLHHPVILAKQLATVDLISSGRLIAGFGAGYVEAEFDAVGVELGDRGELMDEYLDALHQLWTAPEPRMAGRHVSFQGIGAEPRPLRPGGPPIVLGGVAPAARRRVVTRANGWYAFNTTPDWVEEAIGVIRGDEERWGRPAELGRLELTVTPTGPFDRSVVERYRELGVDRLVLLPNLGVDSGRRHAPVEPEEILRAIDTVAGDHLDA